VALLAGVPAVVLAEAMPSKWSDFIRNAPMDKVRPIGTRAAAQQTKQVYGTQSYTSGSATAFYYPNQQQQGGGGSGNGADGRP